MLSIGRFVAVLRARAAFPAATNRMPWALFLLYSECAGRHHLGLIIIVASLVFVRRNERYLAAAEQAIPNPLDASSPAS